MTFVEITSLIAAVSGSVAGVTGLLSHLRQRRTDMRRPPIFEASIGKTTTRTPGILKLRIIARNSEVCEYTLESIKSNEPIFVQECDMPTKSDQEAHPIDWPGLENILLQKHIPAGHKLRKNGDHYSFPFSSRKSRASITLIWRWNDESRSRKTKKKLIIPPRMNS